MEPPACPPPFKPSESSKRKGFAIIRITDNDSCKTIHLSRGQGARLDNVVVHGNVVNSVVAGEIAGDVCIYNDEDDDYASDYNQKERKLTEPEKMGTEIPLPDRGPVELAHEDQKDECRICLTNQKVVTFTPCGHLCACNPCVQEMYSRAFPELFLCPCCNAPVETAVRTFV